MELAAFLNCVALLIVILVGGVWLYVKLTHWAFRLIASCLHSIANASRNIFHREEKTVIQDKTVLAKPEPELEQKHQRFAYSRRIRAQIAEDEKAFSTADNDKQWVAYESPTAYRQHTGDAPASFSSEPDCKIFKERKTFSQALKQEIADAEKKVSIFLKKWPEFDIPTYERKRLPVF